LSAHIDAAVECRAKTLRRGIGMRRPMIDSLNLNCFIRRQTSIDATMRSEI